MSDEELEKLGISTHQVEVRRTILMPRGSYKTTRETKRKITLAGRSYRLRHQSPEQPAKANKKGKSSGEPEPNDTGK